MNRENNREFQVGDLVCILRGLTNWTPVDANGVSVNVATVNKVCKDSIIVSFDTVDPTKFWVYEKPFAVILEGVPAPFQLAN